MHSIFFVSVASLLPIPISLTSCLIKPPSSGIMQGHQNNQKDFLLTKSREAFIDWAKENAVPIKSSTPYRSFEKNEEKDEFLHALSAAIQESSSSIVLLSEGCHNCKEIMSLHHRIIQHLIIHSEFKVVMSESGLPESKYIADYVLFSKKYTENKEYIYANGLNRMYSAWKEGRELIEWIKEYNNAANDDDRPRNDELVQYCGLDIGGFYANWKRPVSKILSYLQRCFPEFEQIWSEKMQPLLDILGETQARYNFQHRLTIAEKRTLAALLDELVEMLDENSASLKGDDEYEWTRQIAISMQLAENYYQNYENMVLPRVSRYVGLNGREIAMANNMIWRMGLEKKENPKGVVINHVIHTKTATQYQDQVWGHFVPMGQIMRQLLEENGDRRLFNVGMVYGGGTFWNKWQQPNERFVDNIPSFDQQKGLEALLKGVSGAIGAPNFFLLWEKAPPDTWLFLNSVSLIRENDYFIKAFPLEWNGCIYLDNVTHATPI